MRRHRPGPVPVSLPLWPGRAGLIRAPRTALLWVPLLLLLVGCQTGEAGGAPGGSGTGRAGAPAATRPAATAPIMGDERRVDVGSLSQQDQEEFRIAWQHFRTHSQVWPLYRDEWLKKGGAAPYVLAENLFGYFFRVALVGQKRELPRIAETAAAIGEPAVAYFAKALVTDEWPLKRPVLAEVMDPDDLNARIKKSFNKFVMDDETRRWTAGILAEIGPPAVPTLASPQVLRRSHPTSRRYAALALGHIGTRAAVDALSAVLRSSAGWEDRAAAATALGLTVDSDTRVRAVLLQAAEEDTDRFVRRKANRALAAADRVSFW